MRKTIITLVVVLVLFVLGVWVYKTNLNKVGKEAIEKQGSDILQVSVLIGEFNIATETGETEVKNLSIANPAGFTSPQVFTAVNIPVKIAPQTLNTPVVMINELAIIAPSINIEQNTPGNNLQTLHRHIQAFIKKEMENPNKIDKRYIIGALSIVNATLYVHAPQKQLEVITIPLADIRFNNIGQEQGGLTQAQVLDLVMQQLNQDIAQALASRNLGNLIDLEALGAKPPSLSEKIRNFFKNL